MPVKMDAPEGQQPAGMVCHPADGAMAAAQSMEPCTQAETTHYSSNQPRAMSRKESRESLKWPKVGGDSFVTIYMDKLIV